MSEKEIDEQFNLNVSEERRAELRKERIEKYGISDMDTAFQRIEALEIKVERILKYLDLGMKINKEELRKVE